MTGVKINIPQSELQKRKLFLAAPLYGGNCCGIFARSVADLAAMCASYKIHLQIYFLFNESLITRARNYACVPQYTEIETEDGIKTIKEIVDTKYSGKVKSLNKDGNFSWNKILNYWGRPNLNKKWINVKTSQNKHKQLTCTSDHLCATIDDPLNPNIKYVPAEHTKGLYSIRLPATSNKIGIRGHNENRLFNNEQLSVIYGTLMGDGYIGKSGDLQIRHCEQQKQYSEFFQNMLGGSMTKYIDKLKKKENGFKQNQYIGYNTQIPVTYQTKLLRDIVYPNGKKQIGKLLPYLNEISLATWYMDDGSLDSGSSNGAYPTASLCTHGFDFDSQLLIKQWFEEKWKIIPKIVKHKKYLFLHFNHEESKKFWKLINKYIISSMQYKIPEQYRTTEFYNFNNQCLDYTVQLINQITPVQKNNYKYKNSLLYDIEVENDHNFIANRAVVHNCDEFMRSECTHLMFIDGDIGFNPNDVIAMLALAGSDSPYDVIAGPYPKKTIAWEKIKVAVNKGFADENPNNLEKYVGDYVFNPKNGTSQIPINAPIEVLEAGTGFMMIRRKTFDKFNQMFPNYRYRPDHVRTAHFDGTREITQFFQAEIDIDHPIDYYVSILKAIKDNEGNVDIIKQIVDDASNIIEQRKANSSKRYLSEDYWFCQKIQQIGLQTWFCPWIQLQHQGTYVFGGSLADIAALGVNPTADAEVLKNTKDTTREKPKPKMIEKKK